MLILAVGPARISPGRAAIASSFGRLGRWAGPVGTTLEVGALKGGRKPCPETIAGTSYGLPLNKNAKKLVRLLGGAEKLAALDPSTRRILLKPVSGNSRSWRVGGLAARGMGQRAQRGPAFTPREIEAEIQAILRERGLLKP